MNEFRIPHRLGREVARQRFATLLQKHGIAQTPSGDWAGTIEKAVPLVGKVRAEYELGDDAVTVRIVQAPAFPSLATIQRVVTDELNKILA